MKVLFLTSYFHPEIIASSYLGDNLREALCNEDIEVELYTPTPCRNVPASVRKEYKKKRVESMHNGRMKVFRFSMYAEGRNPVLRALRYLFCWCAHFWRGIRAQNVSCIFLASTPPIQGMIGAIISKFRKIRNMSYR